VKIRLRREGCIFAEMEKKLDMQPLSPPQEDQNRRKVLIASKKKIQLKIPVRSISRWD
jgi:hypothetical protein